MSLFSRNRPDPAVPAVAVEDLPPGPYAVPSWPSGEVRFDGNTLEFGAGELTRVPLVSLQSVEIKPKAGRLSLKIGYQAGLSKIGTSAWIEEAHGQALAELVCAVNVAMEAARG